MESKLYIVDTFSDCVFRGNQAGVCLLEEPINTATMQQIAAENKMSETAFIQKGERGYHLRWFTPTMEIDLCGHATLACAFIIMKYMEPFKKKVAFETISGELQVTKENSIYQLDIPARKPEKIPVTRQMVDAINVPVIEAFGARDLVLVVEEESLVAELVPNIERLISFDNYLGVTVTAKGSDCDFVSRFFAPNAGIVEDPVTGSSHASLVPLWSERLKKTSLTAKQLSKRGGELYCQDNGSRVIIGGEVALYLVGTIHYDMEQEEKV